MAIVNTYIDLLQRRAIRSPSSASPATRPDFRDPASHTLNVYFMSRSSLANENYTYQRFATGTPQAKIRRNKPPDYGTFVLTFNGVDSPPIDIRLTNEGIARMIGSMASVGYDNIKVAGNLQEGWIIEFVNALAGFIQPAFSGRMVAPSTAEISTKQITAGGAGVNAQQELRLSEGPLVVATGWSELTAGSLWGWTASLDTTSIPQSVWDKGDLILDITLEAINVRTGSDGITALHGTTRSGADGVVVAVGSEAGRGATAKQDANGVCYLVAQDGTNNYGTLFKADDVGRSVSNNPWLAEDCHIEAVIDTPFYNAAILDSGFSLGFTPDDPPSVTHFDLGGSPSRVYKSATATFTTNDVGNVISGDDLADNTTIEAWIAADTIKLSRPALKIGSAKNWTITALAGNIFQSATIAFVADDVGARIEAPQIPVGTNIVSIIDGTHAVMSQKALGVASGQAWTLRPAVGFSGPQVTQITPGTLLSSEKQRITLTQTPIGGKITLRDGGNPSLPTVDILAPITAQGIQDALNSRYANYQGVRVTELIPGGSFDIDFGNKGKQYVLVVDQSQALYERRVAQIPIGEPPIELPPEEEQLEVRLPAVNRFLASNLIYLGVPNASWIARTARPIEAVVPDGTYGIEVRIPYATVYSELFQHGSQIAIGSKPPDQANHNAFFDHADNINDRAGIRTFEWVGYHIPPNHNELLQQQRPVYIVPIQVLNGNLIDMQLASVSMSTWMAAQYTYFRLADAPALPPDGPFGSIIHFAAVPGFQAQEVGWFGNGFGGPHGPPWVAGSGTIARSFVLSWARRRWKSDIWEQVKYVG